MKKIKLLLLITLIFWLVQLINHVSYYQLLDYGLVPREYNGLIGIIAMPMLHGSWMHLISNTLPFLVMGLFIIFDMENQWLTITILIWLISGLMIWVFGRTSTHIGASGIVFGYFGYLIVNGFFQKKVKPIMLTLVTLILYGGMIWGLLPSSSGISFEAHIFGVLSGIMTCAYITSRHTRQHSNNNIENQHHNSRFQKYDNDLE